MRKIISKICFVSAALMYLSDSDNLEYSVAAFLIGLINITVNRLIEKREDLYERR
ncbi:hypothetical protein Calle1_46 [Cellulophaga phage Calle_1]|uniref:Uncharacterized protein n=2 Tax=Callevirus TaxID=2948648 RepID=S0A1J6_9CAUD|nr:hypothetical protein Phi38:1_gp043 [Cellulophaga phage phi38:1]YP_010356574.1 hypothetical protein M1M22_gp069 [Cellulophaga phage Calle_1]AGO47908.1 hypothetical protein Phi40:1_gp043 [Cellulophaga phage phi40:1]QQV89820.1 hypothetical protein Calle2_46 [Cellulophaga phage Calle_2]QQV89899.1 hypothetical protein Calle3_46 [Cellulophaga phage Calle_3]AGO48073.1 hypothetical protein Phi38:1_gp043 [Cellulophaga phage phi38:1]QQV89769.1 hypothetical protein Calle1_46 [Cellulophaga phage Calle